MGEGLSLSVCKQGRPRAAGDWPWDWPGSPAQGQHALGAGGGQGVPLLALGIYATSVSPL